MASLLDSARQAYALWLELCGLDPDLAEGMVGDRDSWSLGENGLTREALEIHDALLVPDDGLTAQMLVGARFQELCEEQEVTLAQVLDPDKGLIHPLETARELRSLLHSPDLIGQRAGFAATLGQAMEHYGAGGRQDVQDLLADDVALAYLRRDAWMAPDQLHTEQFLAGKEGDGKPPAYNTLVRAWRSLSDLLAAHAWLPEGVSLALVRPALDSDLFFCFVVRRGGNLWLLHDAQDTSHPLESSMRRRPGRALERRMARFRFPYETAGAKLDDEGEARLAPGDSQALALPEKLRASSQPLCHLNELPADELAWVVLAMGRIMERFWNGPAPRQALTQVAGQFSQAGPGLLEHAHAAGLPVEVPEGPVLEPLSVKEVASLHARPDAGRVLGETGALGDRQWLVERFASQVPGQAMNLIGSDNDQVMCLTHEGMVLARAPGQEEDRQVSIGRKRGEGRLQQLDPTRMGDARSLDADRKFVARSNLARSIGMLAKKEFDERQDEVVEWLAQAWRGRLDFLLGLAGPASREELLVVDWEGQKLGRGIEVAQDLLECHLGGRSSGSHMAPHLPEGQAVTHLLAVVDPIQGQGPSLRRRGAFLPVIDTSGNGRWSDLRCAVTDAKANLMLVVQPANAVELAWLLGVDRQDLPVWLRQFTSLRQEYGNSILDRIDPMLWALDNPWDAVRKGIQVPLSKRGLAKLQKEHPHAPDLSHLHGASLAILKGEAGVSMGPASPAKPAPVKPGR